MTLSELQAELRHFAAERDWQPFHTPKNLSTALMVESAELAEIFQWMTPEQSRLAHQDAGVKQSISDEVADVLLYLFQVADHCEIDVERAVKGKLTRNGLKYPAKRQIARVSPARASVPGAHVLLDYENVQPSDVELRATKKVLAKTPAAKQASKAAAKEVSHTPAAKKRPAAKVTPAKKATPMKKVVVKAAASTPAKVDIPLASGVANGPIPSHPQPVPVSVRPSTVSASEIRKFTEIIHKLGGNRPTKLAAFRRLLKSLLAVEPGDPSIEVALDNLVAAGVVAVGAASEVKYPAFEPEPRTGSTAP
jgi:NTP pyrophosphatase (non-canonical NTP hydrolase)